MFQLDFDTASSVTAGYNLSVGGFPGVRCSFRWVVFLPDSTHLPCPTNSTPKGVRKDRAIGVGKMKQRLKGPAVALVVAVGTAGGVTMNAMTAPEAQAFGLGDVWGAAKKAGGVAKTVGKGAVEVGRGTVRAAKGLEEGIGRTVREGRGSRLQSWVG